MVRSVILASALLGSLLWTSASTALATSYQTPTVDVQTVGDTVSGVDPQQLAEALETPLATDALPEGFTDAVFVAPESTPGADDQLTTQGVFPTTLLPNSVANVSYAVEGDPEVLGGIATINSLSYGIFAPNIAEDPLTLMRERAQENLATPVPLGGEIGFQETNLDGMPALLFTVQITDPVNAVAQIYAVPVGNVVVFGVVTIADQDDVDPNDVLVPSQELTLAGIRHLATVAQGLSA